MCPTERRRLQSKGRKWVTELPVNLSLTLARERPWALVLGATARARAS